MAKSELDTEVYQVVRDAAREGVCLSVSEVARRTGAPRSSVYRVANHYGYKSWVEFTNGLRRYFAEAAANDSVGRVVDAVARAVLRHKNGPILIDAIGDAEISASYLQYRLAEQGFVSMVYTQGIARTWARDEGTGTEGDEASRGGRAGLVIVINESGMSLLRTVLDAAELGYETVAVTSSHDTPVSKVCSTNVVIKNNKSTIEDYQPNYFAAGTLAFVERLLKAISMEVAESQGA